MQLAVRVIVLSEIASGLDNLPILKLHRFKILQRFPIKPCAAQDAFGELR